MIGLEFLAERGGEIAAVSTFAQCMSSGGRRMQPLQVLFNTSTVVLAVGVAAFALQRGGSSGSTRDTMQ